MADQHKVHALITVTENPEARGTTVTIEVMFADDNELILRMNYESRLAPKAAYVVASDLIQRFVEVENYQIENY
ncbi:hypothetical protein R4Z09_10825 [Niallia oryzisoli]|uniref:Uncharacterized protein n=1 Tax=Niallia oryzisoli TaxID=1737571 RepID=A0ABZ2CLK5_9BACI